MAKVKTLDLTNKLTSYEMGIVHEAVHNALVNFEIQNPDFSWTLQVEVWDQFNKIEEN